MPSKRKRIGFLPRSEVQIIIDNICKHNNFSQSKVTGILVEEALSYRGLLNSYIDKSSLAIQRNKKDYQSDYEDSFNSEAINDDSKFNLEESCIKDEVQMINDFIEFKFFKNIMNKNKKNL